MTETAIEPSNSPLPLTSDRPLSRGFIAGVFLIITLLYALLWCPDWYPLSDSSLYMILARGLMQGRGIGFLRQVHRDVRPLTPMMLWGILKCGGRIGAIHAVMIALTLISHFLAFLTLRKWFNDRIALLSVVVMASSWWMFANAFTIMTEPIFLVAVWGSLLALEGVARAKSEASQWVRVVLGVLLLLAAFEDRIAAVPLIPAIMFGLWMSNRNASVGKRIGWMLVFCVVFAGAWAEWKRPKFLFGKPPVAQVQVIGGAGVQKVEDEDTAGPDAYKLNALVNVSNPFIQLPVSGGRWITESMAAATSWPFGPRVKLPLQYAAGVAVFLVFLLVCVGWFRLVREQKWYMVAMVLYFGVFWIMWGNRIKPRYMFPILPQLFIQLWMGTTAALWWLRSRQKQSFQFTILSRWVAGVLAVGIVALNAVPYGIEVYIRRQHKLNFYDIARRGAFGELVDVGGFLQKNSDPSAGIWMNWGPNRRVLGFLADRDFKILPPLHKRGTGNISIKSPADRKHLNLYFRTIVKWDKNAEWAVVFYDQYPWPTYHLPLAKQGRTINSPPKWWQLYRREKHSDRWVPVAVPVDRSYVREVPGIHDRVTTGGGK